VIYCGTLRREVNTDHLVRPAQSSTYRTYLKMLRTKG